MSFLNYVCVNLTYLLQNCEFRLRGHYHCLKPGCHFVTIGTSKLPWHMKKHEKIAKREASGFKYYTKKDQCGRRGNYNLFFNEMKSVSLSYFKTNDLLTFEEATLN